MENLSGRMFNRFLDIVQVLQDRLLDHALKEDHRQRLQFSSEALRLGLVNAGEHNAAIASGNAVGGDEHETTVFRPRRIELVLLRLRDPLLYGGFLAEE